MFAYSFSSINEDELVFLGAVGLADVTRKGVKEEIGELKNAGIKVDDRSQCLCVKIEPSKRIDGAVTLIILYEMYRRYRTEYKQIVGQ